MLAAANQNRVVGEVLALEEGDPDRQHAHVGLIRHRQGPEELVPGREQRQEPERRQGRTRERHIDVEIDLKRIGAFEFGGFVKIARDAEKILPQQEDAE